MISLTAEGRKDEQGSALIIATLVTVILSLLGISYLMMARTLALTSASVSWWCWRRSEWPTTAYAQPSLASIAPETSPVYAPLAWAEMSCAPYLMFHLSPSTAVCTLRIAVNAGSTATSTWVSSFSLRLCAICWTSLLAS